MRITSPGLTCREMMWSARSCQDVMPPAVTIRPSASAKHRTVLLAVARGIEIRSLSTELVGDIDLQGLLGLNDSVPAGYRAIRIKMDIEVDCSSEEFDELPQFAQGYSAVCNTVCRPGRWGW